MAFYPACGNPKTEWMPRTASQAFAIGSVVHVASGTIAQASNSTVNGLRIIARNIASTDDDYAVATNVPCWVPTQDILFYADVQGTLTTSMIGNSYDLYSSTGIKVDVGNNSYKQCQVIAFISASKALVRFAATMLLT